MRARASAFCFCVVISPKAAVGERGEGGGVVGMELELKFGNEMKLP